jgi:2,3-dihydroxybenzoate decarboxylase
MHESELYARPRHSRPAKIGDGEEMVMRSKTGKGILDRREFLRKAGFTLLTLAGSLEAKGPAAAQARGESATASSRDVTTQKPYRITVEAHAGTGVEREIFQRFTAKSGFASSLNTREGAASVGMSRIGDIEEFRLPAMDESDIRMQVLSSGMGMQAIEDVATAVAFATRVNDAQAETIRKHPGRFAGFASLPTQDPKAAADELERAVVRLGFKGATIQGHTNGEYLDEKKYRILWERAAGLGVPIYLHPMEPPAAFKKYFEGHPELMGATWVWGVDTATHALRIIGAGVFDEFPKATIMLGHMGEGLPYVLGRLDEGYSSAFKAVKLKRTLSEYVRENCLISTSGKYRPETLVCAISAMGVDRILFGDDYPFVSTREAVQLVQDTPISDSDRAKIFHLNAERWLRL